MERQQKVFLRDFRGGDSLEAFFVSAVAAILLVRFALHLAGYPQVGGARYHIAHMLWGGLLMMAALLGMLIWLTRPVKRAAAVVGGVGFGLFIDEVGKFVTRDNDYFFRPSIALIYVVLVLTAIAARTLRTHTPPTRTEYLVNGLREIEDVALHDLDPVEQKRALRYLEKSDPENPLVPPLRRLVAETSLVPLPSPGLLTQLRQGGRRLYERFARLRFFNTGLVAFFVLLQAANFVGVIIAWTSGSPPGFLPRSLGGLFVARTDTLSGVNLAETASTVLSGVLALVGVVRLRSSRAAAYRMFLRAVLVSIFLTQVFAFYRQQLGALVLLGFNILVLLALRFALSREESGEGETGDPAGNSR